MQVPLAWRPVNKYSGSKDADPHYLGIIIILIRTHNCYAHDIITQNAHSSCIKTASTPVFIAAKKYKNNSDAGYEIYK